MRNHDKSQILLATIILMMVTLGIGAVVLLFSRSVRETTHQQLDVEKAYSLANSGLQSAIYCVKKNPTNFDTVCAGNYSLGDGFFQLTLANTTLGSSTRADITSKGSVGKATRILQNSFILSTLPVVPCIGWTKAYGESNIDYINSVQQTSDGGYISVGETYSFNDSYYGDALVIKTDPQGNIAGGSCTPATCWVKTYGGPICDELYSVNQTLDGGYILGGYTWSNTSSLSVDGLLIKTDSRGNITGGNCTPATCWVKTYGTSALQDKLYIVKQTNDTGYILGGTTWNFGTTNGDFFVIKTDSRGNITGGNCTSATCWAKTYGGNSYDVVKSLQQTSDGGYILGGYTQSNADFLVIKTDSAGNYSWGKYYGGANTDYLESIHQITTDNGYILGGRSNSFTTLTNFFVVRTNSTGNVTWAKTYGNWTDYLFNLRPTSDGGYILGGGDTTYNAELLKIDSQGGVEWGKMYGGSNADYLNSVQQTSDGGYILAGATESFGQGHNGNSDAFLIKADSLGNITCCNGVATNMTTLATNITLIPGTNILDPNPWLFKQDVTTSVSVVSSNNITSVSWSACNATTVCPK